MGFPISSYALLTSFVEGDEVTALPIHKNALLEQFRLFGMVLHDPKRHVVFDVALQREFDWLSYITGSHFLFFALTAPSEMWLKRAGHRHGVPGIFEHFQFEEETRDKHRDSEMVYHLATSLGIPHADLPVIILSSDPGMKKFTVLRTDESSLGRQLPQIGMYCDTTWRAPYSHEEDPAFEDLMKAISLPEGSTGHQLTRSLSSVLSELVAFAVPNHSVHKRDAAHRAKAALDRIRRMFYAADQSDPAIQDEWIAFLGMLSMAVPREATQQVFVLDSSFEHESRVFMNTFNKLHTMYAAGNGGSRQRAHAPEAGIQEMDYSYLVLPLSKIVELEFNLSLVQYFRREEGIDMPTYFNRYAAARGQVLVTVQQSREPWQINLNQRGYGHKWRGLTLAQVESLLGHFGEAQRLPMNIGFDSLVNFTDSIRIRRNMATHTEVIGPDQYEECQNAFRGIYDHFSALNRIKRIMRGEEE